MRPAAFQAALLAWYDEGHRDLPWRARPGKIADPYRVWLSEIMLQQTTVKAVIPYFGAFLAKWPTIGDLAGAGREEVMAAWAGLGYYSRARNLYACAQKVSQTGFPASESGLRQLPGVGAYTAAAIAAIAFGEAATVVDGNVERVISRIFAVEDPLPSSKQILRSLAQTLTPSRRPGDYAQALMDLGATICTPRSPSCPSCPVAATCRAFAKGDPACFPKKAAKSARPARHGAAFVLSRETSSGTSILLRQRPDNGLLGGMLEVPGTAWTHIAPEGVRAARDFHRGANWQSAGRVTHTFTHFLLSLDVFAGTCHGSRSGTERWEQVASLPLLPLPGVMRKVIGLGLECLKQDPAFAQAPQTAPNRL